MKLLAFLLHARIKYQAELDTFKKPEPFSRKSFLNGVLFFIKYLLQKIEKGELDE